MHRGYTTGRPLRRAIIAKCQRRTWLGSEAGLEPRNIQTLRSSGGSQSKAMCVSIKQILMSTTLVVNQFFSFPSLSTLHMLLLRTVTNFGGGNKLFPFSYASAL